MAVIRDIIWRRRFATSRPSGADHENVGERAALCCASERRAHVTGMVRGISPEQAWIEHVSRQAKGEGELHMEHEPRWFNRAGGGEDYAVQTRVLRDLLSKGLIEVVSLGPAVYRVTKLGRLARRSDEAAGGSAAEGGSQELIG
jgi:hypothetical protein